MAKTHLLIGNRVGNKGEIIVIASSSQKWTHNEVLSAWLVKYPDKPVNEYHRNFSLVIVSDRTPEQLAFLSNNLVVDNEPSLPQWYFSEPAQQSLEWSELFTTGQIEKTWVELEPYLRERQQ